MFQPFSLFPAVYMLECEIPSQIGTCATHERWLMMAELVRPNRRTAHATFTAGTGGWGYDRGHDYDLVHDSLGKEGVFSAAYHFVRAAPLSI